MFSRTKEVLDNIGDDIWKEEKAIPSYELDTEDIVYYKVELSKLISQARKNGIEVTNMDEGVRLCSRGEIVIVKT